MDGLRLALGCLGIATCLVPSPSLAGTAARTPHKDCFAELLHGRGPELVCTFPVRMTDEELDNVRQATRGVLQNAFCEMEIRIKRSMIDVAVVTPDHVFEAPPQPVSCEVHTTKASFPVTFTFAPKVEFVGGQAVKASPQMANVQGVTSVLAWPVVTWVNRSSQIQDGMLQVVNAYLRRYGPRSASAR
jgi:hypothetical protein